MQEVIMCNVREKLSKVRENCVGMSDEIYALTDYMSSVASDHSIIPVGMTIFLLCTIDDIKKGENGYNNQELPENLIKNKYLVLSQIVYFPQVIDAIADSDFAKEFREICKEVLNIDPPKRVNAEVNEKYPIYVKVAVDWWANAIMSPKFDNGDENSSMGRMLLRITENFSHEFTEDDIKLFKNTLAEEIFNIVEDSGRCDLSVDYEPCEILANAGDIIGLCPISEYPWKTNMSITKKCVAVKYGGSSKIKGIWCNEF